MRSPCTATKSSPRSPQLEKARAQQQRPNTAKNTNKQINKKIYLKKRRLSRKTKDSTNESSSSLPTRCALFLVLKGELELARNDIDLCQSDLQRVLFLLESCTGGQPGPYAHGRWWEWCTHCNTVLHVKLRFSSKPDLLLSQGKAPFTSVRPLVSLLQMGCPGLTLPASSFQC